MFTISGRTPVAWYTKSPSIINVKSQLRVVGKGLYVVSVHITPHFITELASIIISFKNSFTPVLVLNRFPYSCVNAIHPTFPKRITLTFSPAQLTVFGRITGQYFITVLTLWLPATPIPVSFIDKCITYFTFMFFGVLSANLRGRFTNPRAKLPFRPIRQANVCPFHK